MTTLELQLDDDLDLFVQQQSQARGYASGAAYIQSLLAVERLRGQTPQVNQRLAESTQGPTKLVDDAYWQRLETEVFASRPTEQTP